MADSMFQDCEYRYVEEDDVLHCKNKDGLETECDNCKGNVHLNCQNYNPKKDLCLKWFEMGVSQVSQYDTCAEKVVYNDKELSRKWSN